MDHTADGPPAGHAPLEPIAIVGMACRLPGSITSPADFWNVLINKKSAQTPSVPKSRFNIDAFYHEDLHRPGSLNVRGGYFLDGNPHDFDPSFFGMSPIEAMWLDPQQRRILEVAYECLENAGLTLEDVAGKDIGAFVGCFTSDYQQLLHREPDFRHEYSATEMDPGIMSARICNVFDLHGPKTSAVINTACSSSITAINQACHALQGGECDGAIAAGVNLIISVDQHLNTAKLGILSPTSTCHTFDAAADGYGRAEGAGAIYLRRLSDAVRDGNPIRAIIRGSAVNTNGKVKDQGITHPSLEGQERVLRAAYRRAGLDPIDTLYVECHGTGTPIGDPIEVHAVSKGMNDRRSSEPPLRLGAVKANIGHSEAASGIFAVIKAALVVESAIIPGIAGFKTLNPAIKEAEWHSPLTRRVGVSSFGYGGTNGHLILEAARSDHGQERSKAGYRTSASRDILRNIRAHAGLAERYYVHDLAYTLNCRRTHFSHRAFTIAQDGRDSADFDISAFESLDDCLQSLQPSGAWSLEEALSGSMVSERMAEPDVAQPLCTAVQIAIVDQLRKWGIVPSAVAGHSSGEIAAAYAAGLLSGPEAFAVAFYRGLAVAQGSPQGSMLAVGLGAEAIDSYICDTDVVIACENSAESVTLSGSATAIQQVRMKLAAAKVFVRELKTGQPYHSPAMSVVGPIYERLLTGASPETGSSATSLRLSKVPMISSVTGHQVHEADINPQYWVGNLTSRVRFHTAAAELCSLEDLKGLNHLVEIGPHSALAGPLKQIIASSKLEAHVKYIPGFVRDSNSCTDLLRTTGRLFLAGHGVSMQGITDDLSNEPRPRLLVDLPPYQWNYAKEYWREPRVSQEQREQSAPRHDLLGRRVAGLSNETYIWKNILRVRDVPWLRDHSVGSELLLPALWQISGTAFSPSQGLVIPESDHGIELVTRLLPQSGSEPGWYSFTVETNLDKHWKTHCRGYVSASKTLQLNAHPWYKTFNRCLGEVRSNGRDLAAASKIELKTHSGMMDGESRYLLHPGAIDTCLQLAIISFERGRYKIMPFSTIPQRIEEMTVASPGEETEGDGFAWTDECRNPFFSSNIQLYTSGGLPILECKAARFKEHDMSLGSRSTAVISDQRYMRNQWKPDIDYAAETLRHTSYKSVQQAVVTLIQLIDHKRPVQRAVLFAEDDQDLIETVASQFPASGSLTVAETHASKMEERLMIGRKSNVKVVPVSREISPWSSSLPTGPDLIICKGQWGSQTTRALQARLQPGGRLLILQDAMPEDGCLDRSCGSSRPVLKLPVSGFELLLSRESNNEESRELEEKPVTFVVKENTDQLLLRELVRKFDDQPSVMNLMDFYGTCHEPHGTMVMLDVDGSILSRPNETQLDVIKRLVLSEGIALVWATFGVHQGRTVEGGLSLGFLRGVRSEHPGAQITSLDVDWEESSHSIKQALVAVLKSAAPLSSGQETEFWLHGDILHINRLIPWACPGIFRGRTVYLPPNTSLASASINGEMVFKTIEDIQRDVGPHEICVQVEMTELQESPEKSVKQPAIVVGHILGNTEGAAGRQVVTFASQNGYSTIVRTKKNLCLACDDLEPAGRAQKKDHIVLLHMPLAFVQMATLICQGLGAQLTVIVRTLEERTRFDRDPLLGSVSILAVQDPSVYSTTPPGKGTWGKPSLLISNSLSPLAREAWKHISTAGRFVLCDGEVGGTLDPSPFSRGASFLTIGHNYLAEGLTFLRENKDAWPTHVQVYSIDKLPSQSSSQQPSGLAPSEGAAVVRFRYGESVIKMQPSVIRPRFSPEAAYLLIGGLGGLGSSLARWLVERGCRHFVFVSRSGMTRPKAVEIVSWIENAGATADMRAIVARVAQEHPIRGVVHAAMVLQDGLLQGMTPAQYHAAVTPKLIIAQVLHSVLASAPLDFFVMTSSISGVLGTPGQTNYNAGNSFLDAFATYRRALGRPACSIALPMILDVGVVAENESIEESLLRLGIYGIDEIEMLDGLELAMSPNGPSHLVLGLDPIRLHQTATGTRMFCHLGGLLSNGDSNDHETLLMSIGGRIVQKCADMLALDPGDIAFDQRSVASYGLDSMISVELQQWLLAEFGLKLSFHTFTRPEVTFKALAEQALQSLGWKGDQDDLCT
ncbi:type I polyketide synthase [Aspergillus ibericus CBS 121593]|uniref:Polyketide synthase n=1 Tax=Aspergillus ibericus CBS 121593 TaxID=1448316 RepID=A0A395H3N0_9EURO|nr:polyketide synthase [Aspergillus ibericus CBS 121593]RAL02511.1 polyketide synthase [Aspergillus ibericus CBS 121593]